MTFYSRMVYAFTGGGDQIVLTVASSEKEATQQVRSQHGVQSKLLPIVPINQGQGISSSMNLRQSKKEGNAS